MNKHEKTKKEAESNPVLIIIDIADFYLFIFISILCEFVSHILLKRVE